MSDNASLTSVPRTRLSATCSFCGAMRLMCRSMVERGNVRVCGGCIETMRDAIAPDEPDPTDAAETKLAESCPEIA